eukprot:GEMP01061829.1.p1 GENE.GEMP01061829.1~~GEMP01061829.1.p1  ORF type:complete len:318 (+),score=35.05 GEMP01061829.1:30-956(+)
MMFTVIFLFLAQMTSSSGFPTKQKEAVLTNVFRRRGFPTKKKEAVLNNVFRRRNIDRNKDQVLLNVFSRHGQRNRVVGVPSKTVRVTMIAQNNAFLRWSPESERSFADPVVNPTRTTELELESRGDVPEDITHARGAHKIGKFYTLKDTRESVVVKWFQSVALPLNENTWTADDWNARFMVETDFLTQSIAHPKLYSDGARFDTTSDMGVRYMQPLLVETRGPDAIHFGLMERQFETFSRDEPPDITPQLSQFDDFRSFLHRHPGFLQITDEQGWYQRGNCLFMTDAQISLPRGHKRRIVDVNTEYDR